MQQFAITRNAFKEVVFVVGGTGITPAIQLIKQLLDDPDDHTAVTLIFANKNPDVNAPGLNPLAAIFRHHTSPWSR